MTVSTAAPAKGRRDIALTLLAVVLAAGLAVIVASGAHSHDNWISQSRMTDPASGEWCCNHIDCAAQPAGAVRETSGGYQVAETGEVIPYGRVLWKSQDGAWWRCRNLSTNATRCLIGPPPGS